MNERSHAKTHEKAGAASTLANTGLLYRQCACGGSAGLTGQCSECDGKRMTLKSRAAGQREPASVPPIPALVHDVLRSPGQPLDSATRAFMETRFGHDFSRVQVHADAKSAESAKAVNARAYTVGSEVVFGEAQYAPYSHAGQRLLAHELAHTVQQNGRKDAHETKLSNSSAEQEADAAAGALSKGGVFHPAHRTPVQIACQGQPATQTSTTAATPAAAPPPLTRVEFDKTMKNRYSVTTIRKGTFQDQAFGDMKEDQWKDWDPGSSSTAYNWIAEAFVNFEKAFGGLPAVKDIVFFDAAYRAVQGKPVKDTNIAASYALGRLTIYKSVEQSNEMFNLKGALESPTAEQAVKRNIVHELGHGIAETALTQGTSKPPGADPDLFKDYRRAVGWTKDEKLFDIQEVAVQDAFKNDTPPPAQYQITPGNVAKKPWKERPLTGYMADNPGDDFAESIMAYVNEPQRLKALSPTRYDFIDKRKGRWLASGQPKVNIWEQAKQGGPAGTLKPSRPPTIWERAMEAK